MEILAKTISGLEKVLASELQELGAVNIELLTRAVRFEGDLRLLYQANLELRTAIRLLVPLKTFSVRNERELYRQVYQIDWSAYMDVDDTLAVDGVTNSPNLPHSKFNALKTKDAIVDQFRKATGRRPNVDIRSPTLRIHLHIDKDQGVLLLDSSGDSLHKRGYRTETLEAPINEVLAAGMILLSEWQRDRPFIDPMCGSGTLLIEAALWAWNMAPQFQRPHFGFMNWRNYQPDLWEDVVREAREKISPFSHEILGYDKEFKAVKITQQNILGAHLEGKIQVERKKFEKLLPPVNHGILMMNPPYDIRLGDAGINDLYRMIGDHLKQNFHGFEAWIISPNKEAMKHIGLHPSKKFTLFNGPLECKFQKFELYEGSKKPNKN